MKRHDNSTKSISDIKEVCSTQSISNEDTNKSPFDHPVYKQLSRINGEINKMTREQLISKLEQFHLRIQGTDDVLRKRLKGFYKEQKLTQAQILKTDESTCPYKYLCVIDFEATCDVEIDFLQEIIEFPAILVDTKQKKIISTFHEYCRPILNPKLSEFCKTLTGIAQETVDYAETFSSVFHKFSNWLYHYCPNFDDFAIVTDGSYDMALFFITQCQFSNVPVPDFSKKWINIRKLYSNFYKTKRCDLETMLKILGMPFEGRQHCGQDDALNISKIVIQMLQDGAKFLLNEQISCHSLPSKTSNEKYFLGSEPFNKNASKESLQDTSTEMNISDLVSEINHTSVENFSELNKISELDVINKDIETSLGNNTEESKDNLVIKQNETKMLTVNKLVETESIENNEKINMVKKNVITENTNEYDESRLQKENIETVVVNSMKEIKIENFNKKNDESNTFIIKVNTSKKSSEQEISKKNPELEVINLEDPAIIKQCLSTSSATTKHKISTNNSETIKYFPKTSSEIENVNKNLLETESDTLEASTEKQFYSDIFKEKQHTSSDNDKPKSIFIKEHIAKESIQMIQKDKHCSGDNIEVMKEKLSNEKSNVKINFNNSEMLSLKDHCSKEFKSVLVEEEKHFVSSDDSTNIHLKQEREHSNE